MVPQSDPKATQVDMTDALKTYGIHCVGTALGHLGTGQKSICVSACFPCVFLFTVLTFGCKLVFKMDEYYS